MILRFGISTFTFIVQSFIKISLRRISFSFSLFLMFFFKLTQHAPRSSSGSGHVAEARGQEDDEDAADDVATETTNSAMFTIPACRMSLIFDFH